MVSHLPLSKLALCLLLISMETVQLPIYLLWLKMGVWLYTVYDQVCVILLCMLIWFNVFLVDGISHWMCNITGHACSPSHYLFQKYYFVREWFTLYILQLFALRSFSFCLVKWMTVLTGGWVILYNKWKKLRMFLFGNLVVMSQFITHQYVSCGMHI